MSNKPRRRSDRNLPTISVDPRPLRRKTAEAIDALDKGNTPPRLFARRGRLIRLREYERHHPAIEMVGEHELRGRLTRVADFVRGTPSGPQHVSPPMDVVRDVLTLGEWPFPELEMIVEMPVLRHDGTVLDARGYDARAKLFYAPAPRLAVPPISSKPTRAQVTAAVALLRDDLLGDFPFVDQASRANALGLLITPTVRPVIDGPVPLGLLDKPVKGTGAGLLVEVLAKMATGRSAALMGEVDYEEEWRKQITAVLLEGPAIIVLDNITRVLASSHLARALTSTTWKDRILGRSQAPELPQRATWVATGNNLGVGRDLVRRSYWIRMDAKVERPWERPASTFRHPKLLHWTAKHRGALLAAILTLARGWVVARRPVATTPTLGGFDAWVEIVGGILAFAEVDGFLGNIRELHEEIDEEAAAWTVFGAALFETLGSRPVTAREIAKEIQSSEPLRSTLPPELLDAVEANRLEKRLGYVLRCNADRIFGDVRIARAGWDGHNKVARWRVMRGMAGNPSTPARVTGDPRVNGTGQRGNPPPSPASPAKHRRNPSVLDFAEVPDDAVMMSDLPEYDLPGRDD